jgi:type VI secretion system secreted protein VgrG
MSGSNIDTISITTALPDTAFDIDSFTGTEQLSRPFMYQAQLHSGQQALDPNALLDNPATIKLGDPSGKGRYISGIVAAVSQIPSQSATLWRYSLKIVPKLYFLQQTSDCRFYHNMSLPDVVKAVLGQFGVAFEDRLQGTYKPCEYIVMFNESYYNFIQRLMEEEGIFYFFSHADGAHTMVLADANAAFKPIADPKITLQEHGAHLSGLSGFQRIDATALGEITFDDYNPIKFALSPGTLRGRTPTKLQASGAAQRTHYAWPAVRGTTESIDSGDKDRGLPSDVEARTKWRMEAAEAASALYHGTGGAWDFVAGFTFELTNDPHGATTYVIQSLTYTVTDEAAGSNRGGTSQVGFSVTAFPAAVPWREAPSAKAPVMSGLYSAIVIGAAGEEIYTDDYGRIQVQFPWDNAGDITPSNTFWARVVQPWGGVGWGHQFTPRVGMEVLVGFLEGDVNRPVVVGSIYNNVNTAIYPSAKKNIGGFRTRSTKGGGAANYNELSWDDTMGSELFFLHAEKDYYLEVENDQTLQIDHCRIVTVNKDETVTIKGKQTITVTGDQTIEVKEGDHKTTIDQGKHTTIVTTGDQVNTVSTGNQTNTVSTGNQTNTISQGNQTIKVDQGNQTITVAKGNRAVKVDQGNETLDVALGSITHKAMQSITLQVGSNSLKIDQTGITLNGMMIKATASAMMKLDGGGMMSASAALVKIN